MHVSILLLLGTLSATAQFPFAQSVVNYSSGTGAAPGYNDPAAALGEPSRVIPGMFGGPVDPFNPPFQPSQIVSIGAGGFLTLQFEAPIFDSAANPFGIDLLVFGNNGFTITNGDFGGGGITDGSTFTFDPPGASRVLVSPDGLIYYELVPPSGLSISVDGLFPTDGQGNFQMPVDPSLDRDDFAGLGLPGIRGLYRNSAGGTGFDLAWARTAQGDPANLSDIRFVRLEGLNGKIEIDGLAIVPEPGSVVLLLLAGALLLGLKWLKF